MRIFLKFNLFLTIVAIVLSTAPASGQTTQGTILGTVTDASHAVIPAAQVTLTETNTNASRTATTNSSSF